MLIVTGSVRSGTSLACRLLEALGADFGDREQMLPANEWNPDGYYENRHVNTINHRLMFGGLSDPSLWVDEVWPKSFAQHIRKLATIGLTPFLVGSGQIRKRAKAHSRAICEMAEEFESKIVKDPRFCLTLDSWQETGHVEKILICLRNPADVARSIRSLTGVPDVFGVLCWRFWNARFLSLDLKSADIFILDYDALVDAKRQQRELQTLFAFLGREFDVSEAEDVCRKIIKTRPGESSGATDGGDAPPESLPGFAKRIYADFYRKSVMRP